MERPVVATFGFDAKDHYRALREVSRRTWARWVPSSIAVLLGVVVLVGTYRAVLRHGHFGAALLAQIPWILLAVFWISFIPALQWWGARRLARSDPSAQGPQERILDAAGFHSYGNGVRLDIPWNLVYRAVETSSLFLFFYNRNCAYYIPKRALSAEQLQAARSLITSQIPTDRVELLHADR